MADHSQKNARPAANTAGAPQAQATQEMQAAGAPPSAQGRQAGTPPPAQSAAAQRPYAPQPKRAPQPRALQGGAQRPYAGQPRTPSDGAVGATPQAGAGRPASAARQAQGAGIGAPQTQGGTQAAATHGTQAAATNQAARGAQTPAASDRQSARGASPAQGAQGGAQRETQGQTRAQNASGSAKANTASFAPVSASSAASVSSADGTSKGGRAAAEAAASGVSSTQGGKPPKASPSTKARPHRRTAAESAQDGKPRATRNTVPLHSTAILQLEQIARNMQRGVNDGALVEAEAADRLPLRLVINALGQMLYRIGQQAEYMMTRIARALRRAFHLLTVGLLLLLRTFLRPIGTLLGGIWHDLASPFVRLFSGFRNMLRAMREASARGESAFAAGIAYAKRGFKAYRHIGFTALSYVLPLTAAAVLALTVWSVLNTPFSLAVTYNDKMIGYVENEAVWESAKKKITDRIRASSTDETFDARPQFNVVSVQVAARRDALEMVDIIISESSDQIQNATGIYVGDTLAGVCTDGTGVEQMLDTTLAASRPSDDPTARVEFVNSITTERGLYFTDSISTLTQLESTLQANNWLQVKLIRTEVSNQVIAFETVEEENPNSYKGTTRVKQRGVDGEKVVTDDVSYINGVEVARVTLSEQILKEPVAKIVTVGTKETGGSAGSYNGDVIQGSGSLLWPVPAYSYTTTEFGGHRGLDICAPYGTPVIACDGGTVIEAGWHWSWGNYILIDHGNGITTRYAHNSSILVAPGANVGQGETIAYVGSTGTSSGNHCHLEVTVNGGLVNPRRFIVAPR